MKRNIEVTEQDGTVLARLTVEKDDGTTISNPTIPVTRQLALNQMAQAAEREEQLLAEAAQQREEYNLWKEVLTRIEALQV